MTTTLDTTVSDLSATEKRRLDQFKEFYNYENQKEALDDLKQYAKDKIEETEDVEPSNHVLDIETDIVYCIAEREDEEPEDDVVWCTGCDESLIVGHKMVGESYGMTRVVPGHMEDGGEMVCGACIEHDEVEPVGTVVYSDDDMPRTIGHYHDRTEREFTVESTRHDAWRVSHSVKPRDEEKWKPLNTGDVILSMSRDAKELKKLDEKAMEYARERGIRLARATGRTSNVFSTTYDLYVESESAEDWELLELQLYVAGLKEQHRDDYRFKATALTGKDSEDMDAHDEKFMDALEAFEDGAETPREAIETVREETGSDL